MFVFGVVAVSWLALFDSVTTPPQDPVPIVGGTEAAPCEFPSVVAILEDDETPVMCTGTLVHPNVVTIAAHCVIPERPIVAVGFGESGQDEPGPVRTIPIETCAGHPGWLSEGFPDVGYCTLTEAVTDVPRVPILAGCELDALEPDLEVTIAGFGASFAVLDENFEPDAEGVGRKRYVTQTVDEVLPRFDEVHLSSSMGADSACFGDSGGPAFVEMDDGTWRVFGAASRLYDPGGFPPPGPDDNICGAGVTYGLLTTKIDWLEVETGYDLTPCHTADGEWAPSEACGDFPTSPNVAAGTWDDGCAGGPLGGGEPLCESVAGTSGGDDSTTGDPADGSSSSGSTTDASAEVGTGGDSGDTNAPTSGAPGPGDDTAGHEGAGGSSSSGAGADAEESSSGCGCRHSDPFGGLAMLAGLAVLFRRRR